ncbi:uncharacterized protein LOC144152576 [Haemaphysalis longicornis]
MVLSLESFLTGMSLALLSGAAISKCDDEAVIMKLGGFVDVTAAYSTSDTYGGANLTCLIATLTPYDLDAGTGTYTWFLMGEDGHKTNITHALTKGDLPTEVRVRSSNDPENIWIATYPYIGSACFVLKARDIENVCSTWVLNDYASKVPEDCTEANEKICGPGFSLYDQSSCTENSNVS